MPRWCTIFIAVTGATYATAQMVQLDLAAQCVPPAVAGTAFALLMSLSNFGTQLSTAVGGSLYERGKVAWGTHLSFQALVAVGAATTAACWLLTPVLVKPIPLATPQNEPAEQ